MSQGRPLVATALVFFPHLHFLLVKAQQTYDTYIKPVAGGNGANINDTTCRPLRQYYEKNQLINPPPELQTDIRGAWNACYMEALNMFLSPWNNWKRGLSIEDNSNFLLCAPLQA